MSIHERVRQSLSELVCACVAVIATLLAQVTSHWPFFHPDLLLDISSQRPLAGYLLQLDPGFHLSRAGETYDGVYYWAMAVDPFAVGRAHELVDMSGYRYGHPLYGWLAAVISFHRVALLPEVFWLLSLVSMGAAAWGLARLARASGASGWWGLVVPASPGLLFSASSALTEPLQVALVCAVLLTWTVRSRCPGRLGALLVLTCLTKEQLVLLPLSLAIHAVMQHLRHRVRTGVKVWLALLGGPLALAAWMGYLRLVLTAEQHSYQSDNIGMPFSQLPALFELATTLRGPDDAGAQIGATAPSLIIAMAVVLAAGSIAGLRRGDALGIFVALTAGLTTGLGWRTLLMPHENLRVPALAVALALLSLGVGLRSRVPSSDVRLIDNRLRPQDQRREQLGDPPGTPT